MLNSENVQNIFLQYQNTKNLLKVLKSSNKKFVSVFGSQCDILVALQEGTYFYRSLSLFVKERQTKF